MATNWCTYRKVKALTFFTLLISCHNLQALTLGPYESQIELEVVTSFLTSNEIKFQQNDDAVKESLGFIVVTDPMNLSRADVLVKDLRDQGIKDLLYIRQGVYQGRVSAGIYSSARGANKRAASLPIPASESDNLFGVIERSRLVSSSSLTILPRNIRPSVISKFEDFTDLTVPRDREVSPGKSPETEDQVTQEQKTFQIELKQEAKKTIEPKPGSEKIVTKHKPQDENEFPLVPFLLIAAFILLIVGSAYIYIKYRAKNRNRAPDAGPGFESVNKPPTLNDQQGTPQANERQLDGSVGAISAYANQILSGQSAGTNEIPQYLATIQMGGTEVLDLISDIIDLSRIEIGQIEIERISFDPESALQDLIKSLLHKADEKGISLQFEPHENLPDLIASDPGKLEKILVPLVRHAIECTASGRVFVSALFDETSELLKVSIKHSADGLTPIQIEELFEASASVSEINNEKTLRFAVSKRFAKLLGGDVQIIHESNHDIMYVVTVIADEILKKQLLLPSGISIDELIESESEAVKQAESMRLKLESVQEEARLELESAKENASLAATALTKAKDSTRVLNEELEIVQSRANTEKDTWSEQERKAKESIEQLNASLEDTKKKLQTQLESRSQSEAAANNRVTDLEEALHQATEHAQFQENARQSAEQEARDQIEKITKRLNDAESQRETISRELQTSSEDKKQNEELRSTLGKAKTRLATELEARSKVTNKHNSQIAILNTQLEESKALSAQETEGRELLEKKIDTLTQDWNLARQNMEASLILSKQLAGDNKLQAEHLASALKKARLTAEDQENEYSEMEQISREKLDVLELELGIAKQQTIEEAKQSEETLATAKDEIYTLRQQLALARTALVDDLAENNRLHSRELGELQTAMSLAEQKLNNETSIKVRVEESSGSQIETLINDVNQARATTRKEIETRIEIEKETQKQIDAISSELEEARQSLEVEARSRSELEQVSEFAREMSLRLEEAEASVQQIQAEKETADLLVSEGSKALKEMKEETDRLVLAEQSVKEKLQQLNVAAAEVSAPNNGGNEAVVSSLPMANPIIHSMMERFVERLHNQISVMKISFQQENYLDLVGIINWLRGEAHNLGLSEFEPVVSVFELSLRQQEFKAIPDLIDQLESIASRIVIPEVPLDGGTSLGVRQRSPMNPVQILLPDSDKKADLCENFVSQLGSKLLEMQTAWQEGDANRLDKNCKWIHRYSIKLQLDIITTPTEELQSAIKRSDPDMISQRLWNFFTLYSQIQFIRRPAV